MAWFARRGRHDDECGSCRRIHSPGLPVAYDDHPGEVETNPAPPWDLEAG